MGILFASLVAVTLVGCKDKYDIEKYYAKAEQDSLIADVITYVYNRPPFSTNQTKFENRFRRYYVDNVRNMRVEKFYVTNNGIHYFYLIRPANNTSFGLRGVGGTFRRDSNGRVKSFREVFVTPGASLKDLQIRGEELFREMVRTGNVDAYQKNPDYIEWPARWNYYDTLQHEWLSKPGI